MGRRVKNWLLMDNALCENYPATKSLIKKIFSIRFKVNNYHYNSINFDPD